MKKRNIFSAAIMAAGLFVSSFAQAQSCDTLRNYTVPANNSYTLWSSSNGLILGQDQLNDGTDNYNTDVWAEPYNIGTSNSQIRAVRMLPSKIQNNSGTASLTVQVYNDNAGEPGTVIGSQVVDYADLNAEMFWSTIEFDTPVSVTGSFFVGYELSFVSPVDSFALATTQSATNFTMFHLSGPIGSEFNDQWMALSDVYTSGGNPINSAFAFDVLLSTGTPPTANFTVSNASACVGGVFNVDGSTSTGTIDDYTWILREDNTIINNLVVQPDGTIVDQISPNTATPSQQRLVLFVSGACKTTGVYTVVDVLPEVDATVTKVDDNCTAGTGSISINATGGNNSYLYSINGGSSTQPNGNFSGLSAGTYNVVVTTAGDGCSYTESIVVGDTPLEDASFTYATNTICSGGLNVSPTSVATAGGTFSAVPTGLVFVNSSTGEIDMTNSVAGTYDVTYTTAGAIGTCAGAITQQITITSIPDADFSYSNTEFCKNDATILPTFPVCASAGTFSSTTGLSIIPGTGAINFSTSTAGTYVVTNTIAASGSCGAATETFSITVKDAPVVNAGTDQTVCEGTTVTLAASGANTYAWDNSVTDGVAFTPGVGTTAYTVIGTAVNGCENTDQVLVTVDVNPTINAGGDQIVCEGTAVTLTASVSAGSLSWNNGVSNGMAFTPTATDTYTATANNNGCIATDDVIVTVNPLPVVSAGVNQTVCDDDTPITLSGTPSGGNFIGNGVTGSDFTPTTAGVGTHTIPYAFTDGNGCENSSTITITVDGCAGVDNNELLKLVVSPNPASDYIEVRVDENNTINNIQLMSLEGKVVPVVYTTVDNQTTQIDVSSVAKGTYFIQLSSEKGQLTRKVIVQ